MAGGGRPARGDRCGADCALEVIEPHARRRGPGADASARCGDLAACDHRTVDPFPVAAHRACAQPIRAGQRQREPELDHLDRDDGDRKRRRGGVDRVRSIAGCCGRDHGLTGGATPTTTGTTAPPSIVPTAKPKPVPTGLTATQSYDVTLEMTNGSGGLDTIDPLERLSVLPSDQTPMLVELGVLQGGKRRPVRRPAWHGRQRSRHLHAWADRLRDPVAWTGPNRERRATVLGGDDPRPAVRRHRNYRRSAPVGRCGGPGAPSGVRRRPPAARPLDAHRPLAVPVRAERRRGRRPAQPDGRGQLMRRYLLIALALIASLFVASGAQAAVLNDQGTIAGVALVPGTKTLPSTVTPVTSSAACADPWLSSDLGGPLPSARRRSLLAHRWRRDARQRDVRAHLGPERARMGRTTRDYVEQFLRDVADASGTLTSPYAVTTQYNDCGRPRAGTFEVRRRLHRLRKPGRLCVPVRQHDRHRPGQQLSRERLSCEGIDDELPDRRRHSERAGHTGHEHGLGRAHATWLHAGARRADAADGRRSASTRPATLCSANGPARRRSSAPTTRTSRSATRTSPTSCSRGPQTRSAMSPTCRRSQSHDRMLARGTRRPPEPGGDRRDRQPRG